MDVFSDLPQGVLGSLAYTAVGLVIMALGYKVTDVLTPGNLTQLIYGDRNRNAALLVSSGVLALAAIVTTAILTSENELGAGLVSAFVYGLLGVVLLAVSFKVMDLLTPGDLGVICTDADAHPAIWLTAAAHLAVGAVVAAAIS